uniref:Uncharacterized protein n=1 Tax=Hyaloperonospora arabidopsidis (strain Emoy2) TaxID=559515 RepID=M4C4Z1_HYAAE
MKLTRYRLLSRSCGVIGFLRSEQMTPPIPSIGERAPLSRCGCALRVCLPSRHDTNAMRLLVVSQMPDAWSHSMRLIVSTQGDRVAARSAGSVPSCTSTASVFTACASSAAMILSPALCLPRVDVVSTYSTLRLIAASNATTLSLRRASARLSPSLTRTKP